MLKNNIFTHKILPIIGLIFFILFVFSVNCFAFTVVENETEVVLPDLPEDINKNTHFIITHYKTSSNNYYCIYYTNDTNFSTIKIATSSMGFGQSFNIVDKDGNLCSNYERDCKNGVWGNVQTFGDLCLTTTHTVLYSTDDIYNSDGTIFFPGTPLKMGVQLMNPMEVEEIPQLITKLLTILVPVGLTIFGILLLVYLLGSRRWLMH